MVEWAVFAAVTGTILVSFVVVPEIVERLGYNPRSARARLLVWVSFLGGLLVPAALTGFLSAIPPFDWLLGVMVPLTVAILYDYYRLNPDRLPWARRPS